LKKNKKDKYRKNEFIGWGTYITDENEQIRIATIIKDKTIPINQLLMNPELEKETKSYINAKRGMHPEGNKFVDKLKNEIENKKIFNLYIKEIKSDNYLSAKKGVMEICKSLDFEDKYCLYIYDETSKKGCCAIVEFFVKEKWKVIVLSKILRYLCKHIENYKLQIKN
jgi:hypothetical protein